MSHDGCREVAWKGQAFPYLMHHPNSFLQTENYGSARQAQGHGGHAAAAAPSHGHLPSHQPGSDVHARAGTGTWNGPAPVGMRNAAQAAAPQQSSAAVSEPASVRLSNGTRMPMLGMGTAMVKDPEVFKSALALGYRHFDCAWFYGNEREVGQGLAGFIAEGRRAELFITSKVWNTHHRPEDVRKSVEESLERLGCGYLDLLLVHWPEAWLPGSTVDAPTEDKEVSLSQTWQAMEALVDEGKVKALGVSNFSLKQVEELVSSCRIWPVVNQVELHPMLAQRKLVGVLFRMGVTCVAYSPLGAQGLMVPNSLLTDPRVAAVAEEIGKTPAQVLLRWNMQRGVPVIAKSSRAERLAENMSGAFEWRLSNEHKALLDTLDEGKRFITFPWKQWADAEEGGVTKPSMVVL